MHLPPPQIQPARQVSFQKLVDTITKIEKKPVDQRTVILTGGFEYAGWNMDGVNTLWTLLTGQQLDPLKPQKISITPEIKNFLEMELSQLFGFSLFFRGQSEVEMNLQGFLERIWIPLLDLYEACVLLIDDTKKKISPLPLPPEIKQVEKYLKTIDNKLNDIHDTSDTLALHIRPPPPAIRIFPPLSITAIDALLKKQLETFTYLVSQPGGGTPHLSEKEKDWLLFSTYSLLVDFLEEQAGQFEPGLILAAFCLAHKHAWDEECYVINIFPPEKISATKALIGLERTILSSIEWEFPISFSPHDLLEKINGRLRSHIFLNPNERECLKLAHTCIADLTKKYPPEVIAPSVAPQQVPPPQPAIPSTVVPAQEEVLLIPAVSPTVRPKSPIISIATQETAPLLAKPKPSSPRKACCCCCFWPFMQTKGTVGSTATQSCVQKPTL
ncbi:MAG: hypothetical protein WCW01_04765 [Gammaproteobacteria bacterium]